MDEVRGGSRTIPNQYSSLLEAKVGGHALWRPQDSRQHGGELGDCGYILDGHFWKLFNVYLDPPDGLRPLARPGTRDIKATRVPNSSIFQSSRSSTVAFEGSLPLTVPPINARFAGSVSVTDSSFAFLACSGVYRQEDVLSRVESHRLQRYLCEHYSTLQRCGEGDVFIVRSTTKASGWVGGLASRGENDVSMNASFGIPGVGDFSVGIERHVTTGEIASGTAGFVNCDKTTGPLEWTVETPAVHPVILGVIRLRKRDRFRRALGIDSVMLGRPRDAHNHAQTPTADTTSGPDADLGQALEPNETGVETASRPATREKDHTHTNRGTAYSTSSLSSISSDGMAGPSSALDHLLDHFLECNSALEAVVGDSALLSSFVERYQYEPLVGNVQFSWELDEGQASVAFLTGLHPLESLSGLVMTAIPEPRIFSSTRSRASSNAMIGTSSSYYDPFTHQQPEIELEYQFYNDMQNQFRAQQSQWLPRQAQGQLVHQQPQHFSPTNLIPVAQHAQEMPNHPFPGYFPPATAMFLPPQQISALAPQQQPVHTGTLPALDGPSRKENDKRKSRKRRRARVDSSSDDSDNDCKAVRLPGACTHCKKLKMKCEFPVDENTCRRCKAGGHECIVEARKPRTAPNKSEYLLAQIRQKDKTISFLLQKIQGIQGAPANAASPPSSSTFNPSINEQPSADSNNTSDAILRWLHRAGRSPSAGLDSEPRIELGATGMVQPLHSLPPEPAPLGMLANLAISDVHSRGGRNIGGPKENSEGDIGVARSDYFLKPAMDARRLAGDDQARPSILVKGLVTFEEVDELFAIFFDRINVVLAILDPVLHTPASTFARCPFLFTIVCATAARYYAKKPELDAVAMHLAKEAAAQSLTQGSKSVELCQAYIIMATYAVPAKKWEEDRNWIYIGLAIRIATDLNLHLPTTPGTNELHERERLNRTRVWLICFNLDRSTSTQFGKMTTLREDFIIRASPEWYKSSPYCSKYDVHLCAYTQLLRVMSRFMDEVFSDEQSWTGFNKNIDWMEVTNRHNDALSEWMSDQQRRFAESSLSDDPSCVYRTYLLPFLRGYAQLVMHSFGFQSAADRGIATGDLFFQRCLEAAKTVCVTMLEKLAPSGYLRYAPDGHFVFISFATAFLVKMLRQEYVHLFDSAERDRIGALVSRVIDVLGSREISIDDKHTPKLYSRFLSGLLARQRQAEKEPHLSHAPTQQQQHRLPLSSGHLQGEGYERSDAGTEAAVERPPEELRADEMLANMHALGHPGFWDNAMMPGYSWQAMPMPTFAPSYGSYSSQQQ